MTRYDPFAYGEIRLDPKHQKGGMPPDAEDLLFAEGESVKQAPPAASNWSQLEQDVDGLWPGASPDDRDAADFGAEILGEADAHDMLSDDPWMNDSSLSLSDFDDAGPSKQSLPSMMGDTSSGMADEAVDADSDDDLGGYTSLAKVSSLAPSSVPTPGPIVPAPEGESLAKPRARREVRRRPLAVPASEAEVWQPAQTKKAEKPPTARRSRRAALAVIMPLSLCAAGGTAASWFLVMQTNPVMAALIGTATLVGALFAWLFLRG